MFFETITNKTNFILSEHAVAPPGMETPHFHNYYEIYLLVQGKCSFSVEDNIYEVFPGDLMIMLPGSAHMSFNFSKDSERILVYYSKDFIDKVYKKKLSPFRQINIYSPHNSQYVNKIVYEIEKETNHPDELSKQLSRSYLYILLQYIIRNPSLNRHALVSKDSTVQLVENLMNYVVENYKQNISVTDLSSKFGYTPNYISNLFRTFSGIGFKQFLILQRIKNAEHLLSTTDLSVISIAYEVGFNDSNYFSVVFKKICGITPSYYRLTKRNN